MRGCVARAQVVRHNPNAMRAARRLWWMGCVAWAAGACTYTVHAVLPQPAELPPQKTETETEPAPRAGPLMAYLGAVDLRLRRGGGRTHQEERVPSSQPMWGPRLGMTPWDPWNRLDPNPGMPGPGREDVRQVATGELGTQEVTVPLADAFAERWTADLGGQNFRDASEDPLATDPDPARAVAFLQQFPQYDGAVWLEVVRARAELPDVTAMQGLVALGTVCTLGVGALAYLVPLNLDTPVDFAVRAYVVKRAEPDVPLAASVEEKSTLEASGSVGFDVDAFRADLAGRLAESGGARLAAALTSALLGKPPPHTVKRQP